MDPVKQKLDNVPPVMRGVPRWGVWRNDNRDGRRTKVPFRAMAPTAIEAKSNDPKTWSDFETAVNRLAMNDDMEGTCFFLGDGFFGIDLDNCVDPETGAVKLWATLIIERLGTYAEFSPSGRGIKVTGLGQLASIPANKTGSSLKPNKELPAEIDFFGTDHCEIAFWNRNRFWAMTGLKVDGTPSRLVECGDEANKIFLELGGGKEPAARTNYQRSEDSTKTLERCIKYLEKMDPAVSGQHGHDATLAAACVCFKFGLPPADAAQAMAWFNDHKCKPAWSEKELDHKLTDALRKVTESGEFGYFLKQDPPPYTSTSAKPEEPAPAPQPRPLTTTLHEAAKAYLAAIANRDPLIDIGIPEISYALGGGVELSEMVIVAARPSHGKSAFGLQCAQQCAAQGMSCLIVSEEMSALTLGKRTLQFITPIGQEGWIHQQSTVEQQMASHFRDRATIYIVESCRTPAKLELEVAKAVEDRGVSVVVVDYAQMIKGSGKTSYEQVSDTSTRLRRLANQHNILLIVLAQLNREIEKRPGFIPKMIDLRETGQLEQDADVVVFLVWPHKIDPKNDPAEFQIFVAKNRNRPINCAAFTCKFEAARQRFLESKPGNYHTEFSDYDSNDEGRLI